MSLTSWVNATIDRVAPLGTIGHRVTGQPGAQRSVITWEFGGKSVYLGESDMVGRKRAIYAVLNDLDVIGHIKRLEADASRSSTIAKLAAEYDGDFLDIDGVPVEPCPTVIESDPYVVA